MRDALARVTRRARRWRRVDAPAPPPDAARADGNRDDAVAEGMVAVELSRPRSQGTGRWAVLMRLLVAADLLAAALAGVASLAVADLSILPGLALVALVTLGWFAIAVAANLYAAEDLRAWASGVHELPRTLLGALILSWPLFGVATLLGADRPLLVAAFAALGAALLSPLARALARAYAHRVEPLKQSCVIVGSGRVADRVVERLLAAPEFGLEPFGIVDDDPHPAGAGGLPMLGGLGDLEDVLRVHRVDRVIIAFSRASHEQLLRAIRACRDRRVAVDIVPRLFEFAGGLGELDQVGGLPLLPVGAPRLPNSSRLVKRAGDVAASALALAVLAPLLAATALAVKVDSRGAVLERRARMGRRGVAFDELRFRTNRREDGRSSTRVGGWLRRHGLDGLPRLVNVLRGQESLVGPRPVSPWEPERAPAAAHQRRLDLRPGLTGPWQVARAGESLEDELRDDYQYIGGWSPLRDVEILLSRVPAELLRRPTARAR